MDYLLNREKNEVKNMSKIHLKEKILNWISFLFQIRGKTSFETTIHPIGVEHFGIMTGSSVNWMLYIITPLSLFVWIFGEQLLDFVAYL